MGFINQLFSVAEEEQMNYFIEQMWSRKLDNSTLIDINIAGQPPRHWARLWHNLVTGQPLTHGVSQETPILKRPGYKLILTTEHSSLQIYPRRQCVYLGFRHLSDGVSSVNLEEQPINQKWI